MNNQSVEPIKEYDANGNRTYLRDSSGFEQWWEYDANGNETHYRDSNGLEEWWEYDANGKVSHYRNSDGFEQWCEYDANGRVTHYRDSSGYESWWEYDANGKVTHYRDSSGTAEWYDANGQKIGKPSTHSLSKMCPTVSHAIADALVPDAIGFIESHPKYAEVIIYLLGEYLTNQVGNIKEPELPCMLFDRMRLVRAKA